MIITKKIKPMFSGILTTCKMNKESDYIADGSKIGLIDSSKMKNTVSELQEVIAVGSQSGGVKVGDIVCVNPMRFSKMQHREGTLKDGVISDNPVVQYNFDIVLLEDEPHLLLDSRDIKYIVEEFEEFEPNPTILQEQKKPLIY